MATAPSGGGVRNRDNWPSPRRRRTTSRPRAPRRAANGSGCRRARASSRATPRGAAPCRRAPALLPWQVFPVTAVSAAPAPGSHRNACRLSAAARLPGATASPCRPPRAGGAGALRSASSNASPQGDQLADFGFGPERHGGASSQGTPALAMSADRGAILAAWCARRLRIGSREYRCSRTSGGLINCDAPSNG